MGARPLTLLLFVVGAVLSPSWARARPVSFLGSTMVMSNTQPMMATLTLDHTPWRQVAVGATYQWFMRHHETWDFAAPEVNVLLARHNALEWQANAFLTGAVGGLRRHGQRLEPAGLVAVEADAESRRWYVLGSARFLRGRTAAAADFQAMGRVGVAPFLAGYEDINPWVVLQYQYMPGFSQQHVVTPMVRLLYQGLLVELGASLRGEWSVNFAAEFL